MRQNNNPSLMNNNNYDFNISNNIASSSKITRINLGRSQFEGNNNMNYSKVGNNRVGGSQMGNNDMNSSNMGKIKFIKEKWETIKSIVVK